MGIGFTSSSPLTGIGSIMLARMQEKLAESRKQLSSGSRLAAIGNDPSGVSMSARMKGLIDSFQVAGRNVSDGISLAQTGESSLGEVSELLGRMRELAVQSGNGTLSSSDRASIDQEFGELRSEIDRLSGGTDFNGVHLLDGSAQSVALQSGAYSGNTIDVALMDASSSTLGLDSLDVATSEDAMAAIEDIDAAIAMVSAGRASFGSSINRLESGLSSIQTARTNLADANSRIEDTDYAADMAELMKFKLLQEQTIATQLQGNLSAGRVSSLLVGNL